MLIGQLQFGIELLLTTLKLQALLDTNFFTEIHSK